MSGPEKLFKIGVICLVIAGIAWILTPEGRKASPSSSKAAQTLGVPATVCHPRNPPSAGECVAQHFGIKAPAFTVGAPTSTNRAQCADLSQWQGYSPNLTGLRCVILQASYGDNTEPSIYSQIADANAHHVLWGAYTFLEPGVSGASEAEHAFSVVEGRGDTLGLWADAEINGVYEHACSYTSEARALGERVYGLFSAPGLWPGGVCQGYLWTSEWGVASYAFGGYPASRVVLHQYCGTCFRYGVETDLDEDYGLLALHVKPPAPKPTPGQLKAQLARELHRRAGERGFLTGHHCRQPPWHAARPNGHWEHACHVELRHGRVTNKIIADLKAKSI